MAYKHSTTPYICSNGILYSYIMTAQNNTLYYRSSAAWSLHILSTKFCIIIIIVIVVVVVVYVVGG